jgi:hypothetical protein
MTTDIQPTPRDTERQAEQAIARRSFDSLPEDPPRPARWWKRGFLVLIVVHLLDVAKLLRLADSLRQCIRADDAR